MYQDLTEEEARKILPVVGDLADMLNEYVKGFDAEEITMEEANEILQRLLNYATGGDLDLDED